MRLDGNEIEADADGLYLNWNADLPVNVGGDIDINGNIKGGLSLTSFVSTSKGDSNGAADVPLNVHESKGICFLTQITFEDIDAGGERAECRVLTDGGGNWVVRAYLAGTSDANAWCVARCLLWDRS